MEKFYRGLDPVSQSIANNAADGSFMNKSYRRVTNILDRLTTHNQAWHSNNADVQTLDELATDISLLTKKFDETQIKKVNVCEDEPGMPKGMYQTQEGPFHEGPPMQVEDANYVNNSQGGYQRQNYQGSYNNSNNFGNKCYNPYIPPKGQSTEQGSSRVEAMLEKVLANQSKSERTLSGLTETVGSHTVAIQKLESQMRGAEKKVFELEPIDEDEEVQSGTPIIVDENPTDKKVAGTPEILKETDDKSKQTMKRALQPLTQLFKSKPPFPQRLVKKKEDAKFEIFYDQLKQLSLNFPFLEAIKEMPDFAKYLKDLLTKKKMVQHETVSLTHTVSSIISTTTVQKKGDPGAFPIPCSARHHDVARTLCDNGASINLMPLVIYKQSGLGMPRPTTMRLHMAERSIQRPVGVVDDVLVRVDEAVEFKMEEESLGEALAGILVNFDAEDMEVYVETVNSLVGLSSYSYHPKKLNLDLKNRTTPPAKPSIIEPPKLELKQLPSYLKYKFLGPNNTLLNCFSITD
ncbi:uncharacterized protein LOC132048878 [Lycium ferocissimum]|uniref:uncharacterized protein LOC132048878 n=1 Tax=Lycium ferocissimum TaxID=112874 RepID=UPI002816205D|nr:uncharacterized protein LOC132048878 [Lycium ferocissimum]